MRHKSALPAVLLIAAMAIVGVAAAVPGGASQVLAADDKKGAEKAQPKEVPAHCARLIKASERQRCLRKSGG
jgi:hypothetical protein